MRTQYKSFTITDFYAMAMAHPNLVKTMLIPDASRINKAIGAGFDLVGVEVSTTAPAVDLLSHDMPE